MATGHKRIQTALGLHPQVAHLRYDELSLFERLLPEAKYVGEIGLDRSQHFKEHFDIQLRVFTHIIKLVEQAGGRIMTIHSRGAAKQVLDILSTHPKAGPAIMHWFSGSKKELAQAIRQGCWFSIGPKMLESRKSRELIQQMPKNRILFETDGPFARKSNCPNC